MKNRHKNNGVVTLYSISEAARASVLTTKTIRYYEQIGLILKALRRNTENAPHTGGDRVYGDVDVARLRFIHGTIVRTRRITDRRSNFASESETGHSIQSGRAYDR